MSGQIDHLIKNSPFDEPRVYWHYEPQTKGFTLLEGRRPAGYIIASESSKAFDDPGRFVEIPLVNAIRPRVKAWRDNKPEPYSGVTGITQRLLAHWHDIEERSDNRFFFCQLEAIETIIWLSEAPASQKVGIDIPSDGGEFQRLCCKMATGSGKTIVMAMLIAWQVLNKVTYPQDPRFSKNVFVVAPGLTVKSRLQVLVPSSPGNYYDEFNVIPSGMQDKMRQGNVRVRNWHLLNWASEERLAKRRSVDKRGALSDEAYTRDVLGDIAGARNILVINDEGHHAWRTPPESKIKGVKKEDIAEATIWVEGLDRIHKTRGILTCFDFSATPFAPSGKQASDEALFDWIISDFSLNDAIESGLVKTPRVVIRDDGKLAKDYKSKFYHLHNDPDVKVELNRKAEPHEPLPDLLTKAYYFLGLDWLETAKKWAQEPNHKTPPVMITVTNRVETAARLEYAFEHKKILIDELCNKEKLLRIDSDKLEMAEEQDETEAETQPMTETGEEPERKKTKKQQAEDMRKQVGTVGKVGQPGEQTQNVISVGMLSEGWDAKTVTHIMGLRAFSSQLLCEQVVGRGLRRTSYDINPVSHMFDPEYVNIFGVPFTFLPHESKEGPPPVPQAPKIPVFPDKSKANYEISWPNVIRVEHTYKPALKLDSNKVQPLMLNAYETATLVELAPIIEGKPDVSQLSQIDLEKLAKEYRWQKVIFTAAVAVFEQMKPTWHGNKEILLAQLVKLVEGFIPSGKIQINPPLFNQDDLKRRIIILLNMTKVVHHVWSAIRSENTEDIVPVFDQEYPIRSTGDMNTWYTGRPCAPTKKSHINMCVFDSTWEASEAFELDRNTHVESWVKNDHLGFEVLYTFEGQIHKYRPDYLITLKEGSHLVLEVKGQDSQKDKTKREFLDEWVKAINQHGGFGKWRWAVSINPADVKGILNLTTE